MAFFNKGSVCSSYRHRRGAVASKQREQEGQNIAIVDGVCPPVLIVAILARDARGSLQTPSCQGVNLTFQEKELHK